MGFGHENVRATHHSTIEFTKDRHLSMNGDCILVVGINRGLSDLTSEFKEALKNSQAKLMVRIEASGLEEIIRAQGSPHLALTSSVDMVLRKSSYLSDRTFGINANKAACDLSRELVEKLKNPEQQVKITMAVVV